MDRFDAGCAEQPRAVLLGATNSWFPITLSALAIPVAGDALSQLVRDGWNYFAELQSEAEVALIVRTLKQTGMLVGIDKHTPKAIWEVVQATRNGNVDAGVTQADIKGPEWEVLTASVPPSDWPHFMGKVVPAPRAFETRISSVLLLERLREVNALLGFTRVEAPEESADPNERAARAALCVTAPAWVPATEVHGEGIFVRLSENAVQAWEQTASVKAREAKLREGHRGWRTSRRLDPTEEFPGVRYAMLHTLSHLVIRELALECGYNAASIRERIYADVEGDEPQAGILIYSASAYSDCTLGGLVELGKP